MAVVPSFCYTYEVRISIMAKKKDIAATRTSEEEALIARVDAMMNTNLTEPLKAPPVKNKDEKQPPPLDIFKDVPNAPTQIVVSTKEAAGPPNLPGKASKPSPKKADIKSEVQSNPPKIEKIEPAPIPGTTIIDNQEIDKAVDEIVVREADTVLAVEDARLQQKIAQAAPPAHPHRFLRGVMTVLMVALGVGMILVIYLTLSSFL
jgi:hypothetical protein